MYIRTYRCFQVESLTQIIEMVMLMIDRCISSRAVETSLQIPASESMKNKEENVLINNHYLLWPIEAWVVVGVAYTDEWYI